MSHGIYAMDDTPGAGLRAREEDEAARVAREFFGVAVQAKRLNGEKDLNFCLTLTDGRRMLLKVFTPDAEADLVGMLGAALQHVARAAPGLPVQRLIPSSAGEPSCLVRFLDGPPRAARLVSFLSGQALDESPHSLSQRRAVGEICARLQLALKGFIHPAADRSLIWDMKTAPSLRARVALFAAAEQRHVLEDALDAYEARISGLVPELPTQAVHNDFNGNNLLVDADAPDSVTGVIDFDDMVRTPRVFDIAVAAAYQMLEEADPVGAICDFAQGFSGVFQPDAREIALLYTAVRTRMAMRLLVPEWRARQNPGNRAYLTRNNALVWRQFARLERVGDAEATDRIARAFAGRAR